MTDRYIQDCSDTNECDCARCKNVRKIVRTLKQIADRLETYQGNLDSNISKLNALDLVFEGFDYCCEWLKRYDYYDVNDKELTLKDMRTEIFNRALHCLTHGERNDDPGENYKHLAAKVPKMIEKLRVIACLVESEELHAVPEAAAPSDKATIGQTGNTNTETAKPEATREGTLQDRAVRVDNLIHESADIMRIFRQADTAWYGILRKHIKGRMSPEKAQRLKKEVFADAEYQTLCKADRERLFAHRVAKRDGPNPLDYLFLPASHPSEPIKAAHIAAVFGIEENRPAFDSELSRLTRYVRLTILHDKTLEGPTTEPINNGIWQEAEDWASNFWKELKNAWCDATVVAEMRRDFEAVKAELRAKAKQPVATEPEGTQGGEAASEKTDGAKKITRDEANVRARQLLIKTLSWDWTCRKLAEQIPCCLGWIPSLPAWRAYHEKRKELRRNKTIETVSLSDELEAVLGKGEKDEVLKQLIAEQEAEEREDARRAKLYLSQ